MGLHGGIWLAMGLDYSAQALAVIIVCVNWALLLDSLRAVRRGRRSQRSAGEEVPA